MAAQTENQATYNFTDAGAAAWLADQNPDLRFAFGGGWIHYTGARWQFHEAIVFQRIQKLSRYIITTAMKLPDDDPLRRPLIEFALTLESANRARAVEFQARNHPKFCVKMDAFDADPDLFNCVNGTLDLRTGELREHDAKDLITKISPVAYDPQARCQLWEAALQVWLPDEADRRCLQVASGYSLTGHVDEEKLFCLFGPEASGKTCFAEAIKAVHGDYGTTADFESFIKRTHGNGGGARGDIARLAGMRFVTASETNDGRELSEGLVKNLTGKEKIVARHMYKSEIEFMPTFKLWLLANHAPYIDPDDGGMWRRLVRFPFVNTIPPERRDPNIKRRLLDMAESGPGILNWMIEGANWWRSEGLVIPESVRQSTDELRSDMDSTSEFFEDRLDFNANFQAPAIAIREAYQLWADTAGVPKSRRLGPKGMAKKLRGRHCKDERDGLGNRFWMGVAVR